VVKKKTQSTPKTVVEACKRRFAQFDRVSEERR
jgi:phage-related protein